MVDRSSKSKNAAATCPACESNAAEPERELDGFHLFRCKTCSMAYVFPRPSRLQSLQSYASGLRGQTESGDATQQDIAALMQDYDREHGAYVRHAMTRRLRRIARGHRIRRMLDFGCGSGHLLGVARELFGCQTFGIEVNPVARLGAERFGFRLHEGTLETLPASVSDLDLVYSEQVFEHLPEPGVELRQLRDLLAPGGLLFVEVPHYESLSIRLNRDRFQNNRPPGHLNYFTRHSLAHLFEQNGFRILSRRTTGLNHRAFLGRDVDTPGLVRATPPPTHTPSPALTRITAQEKIKLRLLALLDRALSLPGWGMQLEILAERTD